MVRKNLLLLIPVLLVVSLVAGKIVADRQPLTPLPYQPGNGYAADWAAVDSLVGKELPKDALVIVKDIHQRAVASNNYAQIIKSLLYLEQLQFGDEEESQVKAIADLEQETLKAPFPAKPILQSILADMYWNYYRQNRYKILQRTETAAPADSDITTWDAAKFAQKASTLYMASLQPADSLQRTPLGIFDSILVTSPQSKDYRPTLYDFLAFKAIDFFGTGENNLIQPAESFVMNNPKYFAPAEDFAHIDINTPDTANYKAKALKLMQAFTAYQLLHGSTTSLVDLEVKRLNFVQQNSVLEEKDSLRLLALEQLEKRYQKDSISAMVGLEIAQQLDNLGNQYDAQTSPQYFNKKADAVAKCKQVIELFPNTSWAARCKDLISAIETKTLNLTAEKVNVPNQPFRVLANYANTPKLYFRLINRSHLPTVPMRMNTDTLIDRLLAQPVLQAWSVDMPGIADYRQHKAEVKVPAQKTGAYYLLAATDSGFEHQKEIVAVAEINVSNIGYITRSISNGAEILVHDCTNGHPLKGATVGAWNYQYDYASRKYLSTQIGTYKTDADGKAIITKLGNNNQLSFNIRYQNDSLITGDLQYFYSYTPNEPETETRVFFFLDRGIYRPGQTLYFKGIVLKTDGKTNTLKPRAHEVVELVDVNGQTVGSHDLYANEYGSFNGTFTLPTTGLTGSFNIRTSDQTGYKDFRVEDYKRPKFEVKFDPIKGSFRLGDKVTVTGKAIGYSGVPVDGALVQYHVTRQTSFPYWDWFGWRKPTPYVPKKEIISDTATTKADGSFSITFTAINDDRIPADQSPEYDFAVHADVTDQNNETQSAQVDCNIGTIALRAFVLLKDNYSTTDTERVKLVTENLNGEFEAAQGTVNIYQLKDPGLLLRKRLWDAPDQYVIKEQDYRRDFPNDIYKDEDDYETWQKGKKVMNTTFDTEKDRTFGLIDLNHWQQGQYVMELETKDHFGKSIKMIKYFAVNNPNSKQMPTTSPWWVQATHTHVQPGEKASIWIGSSAKDVQVLYEVVLKGKVVHKEWVKLSREKQLLELPVDDSYIGGATVQLATAIDSRVYTEEIPIVVPFPSNQLSLKLATFRDKLTPGAKEQWKLTVAGPKGEKVAAEMLANMYDASLDAFAPNDWYFNLERNVTQQGYVSDWNSNAVYQVVGSSQYTHAWQYSRSTPYIQGYDRLNWFICTLGGSFDYLYNTALGVTRGSYDYRDGDDFNGVQFKSRSAPQLETVQMSGNVADRIEKVPGVQVGADETSTAEQKPQTPQAAPIVPRTNFNETAFFFPNLETDSSGNVVVNFTVPDALTRWKFQAFAHTKDLLFGLVTQEVVAQKDLMVTTNAPRFLREGDTIELTAKISSLSAEQQEGVATLTLTNPVNNQTVSTLFGSSISGKLFTVKQGQSTTVSWKLIVPPGLSAVSYRITANVKNFSDGEEAALPILSNRMLVTETMPINIKGGQQKTFNMDKLLHSGSSTTLTQHQLTFELTSNPAWYALQSLPYIMEYPYECSEQLFSRFYANTVATRVISSNPRLKEVFETWRNTDALVSNLEKNKDLKQLLLEETPWVLQAKDESERKKRVGLLFDLNHMDNERDAALNKLKDKQAPNGGWPWFKGMPDNRFITQYIITGMGKLQHMGVLNVKKDASVNDMVNKGISYLDYRIAEDYADLIRYKADLKANNLSEDQVQYLYARSFFTDKPIAENARQAYDYYRSQAQTYWTKRSKYSEAMIALTLYRTGDSKTANEILRSLKQTAIYNEEQGMYWKDNAAGYYWYQAPIEAQAAMVEAFSEIAKDNNVVDELRTWLLKQKQVQDWGTTKATADACYALLLNGTDWLNSTEVPQVTIGSTLLEPGKNAPRAEAGTGYYRTEWRGKDIQPAMGKVTISKQSKGLAWGALYWQYFEQLDKITPANTPLKLTKQLYLQQNTSTGPKLTPIDGKTTLKPGDLVKVRITLRVDRDMDFVQMKDMRAAGFEPTSTLSEYQYQGGLGYYQSTRDAATNFFFDRLPKGSWVFEYSLRVGQRGNFSNGITTIQSMYAPEFTSHSQGIRVTIQ